jgi:hypothetical protein
MSPLTAKWAHLFVANIYIYLMAHLFLANIYIHFALFQKIRGFKQGTLKFLDAGPLILMIATYSNPRIKDANESNL